MSARSASGPGRALLAAAALLAALAAPAAADAPRAKFDTRVLAAVPSPGYPALSLVASDRRIYVGSFENPAGDSLPSKVFRYGPDGALETSYAIFGQDLSKPHGVQVAAEDGSGRLYLMDQSPPRVLRLDPRTGVQEVWATFSDVPPCAGAPAGAECSQTVMDNPPEPDYAAWGPDGAMYVTDYQQGLIWRVPPGGGAAHVWFSDPLLDGTMFDAAGIVLMPDHHTLLLDTAASATSTGPDFTSGKVFTLPIKPDGKPGTLSRLWTSQPREAPDGLALAASGNVYVALVGPGANQLVEVSPLGQELARYPDAATNSSLTVPYDEPSSVQFDGQRMIVTNLAYFSGNTSHMVLFDVWAGEPGAPVFRPAAGVVSAVAPPALAPPLSVAVSPRRLRAGRRARLVVLVSAPAGARQDPVAGAAVRLSGPALRGVAHGRRVPRTGASGRTSVSVRPRHRGSITVTVSKTGFRPARGRVTVSRRRRPRRAR